MLRQVGYQVRTFCRTPIAVFFTIALPLIMLVLFNALFGDTTVDTGSGEWPMSQFYIGGLARVHGRVCDVHQPRQHGADPP